MAFNDNVQTFKELVMSGMPKLITKEAFASDDEKEAIAAYITQFGVPMNTPDLGPLLLQAETQEEIDQALQDSMAATIDNKFRGTFGL